MTNISRTDGKNFVVPAYRDILSAKKPALLKKEILLLSKNYGNFITLQRKNADQYEACFATEPGYLFGESIWNYFKKPVDLIYCETIPNTTDALLVIVQAGSVYLDGTFPVDSIADELVVFLTQKGDFDIYIHGDVPISEHQAEGKFTFPEESIKSFTILDKPIFGEIKTPSEYLLRSADSLLKSRGIGVFPVRKAATFIAIPIVILVGYFYFSTHKESTPQFLVTAIDPWQNYFKTINNSPTPAVEIQNMLSEIAILPSAPGWQPTELTYASGRIRVKMTSLGMNIAPLFAWATTNNLQVEIGSEGIFVLGTINSPKRVPTQSYSSLNHVIADFVDRVNRTWLGITVIMGETRHPRPYKSTKITIQFTNTSIQSLMIIAKQLNNIPVIFKKAIFSTPSPDGQLSGTLIFQALGK